MRKTLLLITCVLLSSSMHFPAFAGEWKQNNTGWWYQNDDGTNPAASWQQINGNWYYFKSDGYMNVGWIKVSDQWYYCESSGEMRTSDLQTDVFTFKFNSEGSCSNFYENGTPSSQAGWASYGTTSLATFAEALASGKVIHYNGQYWGTPDYVSSLKNENIVYFHEISTEAENGSVNRYGLADLDIPDSEDESSSDLDGFY